MGKTLCGAISGTDCPKGPKKHHKCGERHIRAGGTSHPMHVCKHCGVKFQ